MGKTKTNQAAVTHFNQRELLLSSWITLIVDDRY